MSGQSVNHVILDRQGLIHTRNKLVLKLLWYSLTGSLAIYFVSRMPLSLIFTLGFFGLCSLTLISYLVSKRILVYQTMYIVVFALIIDSFLIVINNPRLSTYPIIFFSMVVAAFYQDYKPIGIIALFGLGLTNLLYFTKHDAMFSGMGVQDLLWLNSFVVILGSLLSAQAINNERLRKEAESKQKDSITKDRLEGLIAEINSSSQLLASASEKFTSTVEQTHSSTEQISKAISEIATGVQYQSSSVYKTKVSVEDMVGFVEKAKNATDKMAEIAIDTAQKAEDGEIAVKDAIEGMHEARKSTEDVNTHIRLLVSKSDEIQSVVELISGIADQTNLLALNAAIESARAGEAGRGFAVVSEEVRRLAEKSRRSAQDISDLLNDIKKAVTDTVSAAETGYSVVNKAADVVGVAGASFDSINQSILELKDEVQSINKATAIIADVSSKVQSTVELIASIAEESSASTEEVSASTEEQTASLEQLAASARELSAMSKKLWVLGQTYIED